VLIPNVEVDPQRTEQRIRAELEKVEPVLISVAENQVIVRADQVITPEIFSHLGSLWAYPARDQHLGLGGSGRSDGHGPGCLCASATTLAARVAPPGSGVDPHSFPDRSPFGGLVQAGVQLPAGSGAVAGQFFTGQGWAWWWW
jgi:hypothetical protein